MEADLLPLLWSPDRLLLDAVLDRLVPASI
jgi:hypothetical protein